MWVSTCTHVTVSCAAQRGAGALVPEAAARWRGGSACGRGRQGRRLLQAAGQRHGAAQAPPAPRLDVGCSAKPSAWASLTNLLDIHAICPILCRIALPPPHGNIELPATAPTYGSEPRKVLYDAWAVQLLHGSNKLCAPESMLHVRRQCPCCCCAWRQTAANTCPPRLRTKVVAKQPSRAWGSNSLPLAAHCKQGAPLAAGGVGGAAVREGPGGGWEPVRIELADANLFRHHITVR